jgi:hypothetical protein
MCYNADFAVIHCFLNSAYPVAVVVAVAVVEVVAE